MNAKSELTTSEAAEVLNVSRRYLTELLEEGEIPFREKKGRRLMPRKEVLDYKRRQREKAEEAMQKLTDLSQELGLGY
jgi:excisionase family DNA binding protein